MRGIWMIIVMALGLGLRAQCPLNQAVDFSVTDVHGNEVHLFDILDRGQYALIDFFFTTCGPCQETVPLLSQAYHSFGCNQHDVFFMEISDRNNVENCLNWTNEHGVEYPTISGPEGGGPITNQYGIHSWPTIILVAPDRSILIRDLWPIDTAQDIINALESHGIQQHECPLDIAENPSQPIICHPNPANEFVTLKGDNLGTVSVYNTLGQRVVTVEANNDELCIDTRHYNNGLYIIKTNRQALRFLVKH